MASGCAHPLGEVMARSIYENRKYRQGRFSFFVTNSSSLTRYLYEKGGGMAQGEPSAPLQKPPPERVEAKESLDAVVPPVLETLPPRINVGTLGDAANLRRANVDDPSAAVWVAALVALGLVLAFAYLAWRRGVKGASIERVAPTVVPSLHRPVPTLPSTPDVVVPQPAAVEASHESVLRESRALLVQHIRGRVDRLHPPSNAKSVSDAVIAGEPREENFDRGGALIDGLSVRLLLDYIDAAGRKTRRTVVVRRVYGQALGRPDQLLCFCEMRRALRHFRVDRIEAIYDPESGEALGDVDHVIATLESRDIAGRLANRVVRQSVAQDDRTEGVLKERWAAVLLLVALGRADGRFHQREKDVIHIFLGWLHPDAKINIDSLRDAVGRVRVTDKAKLEAVREVAGWPSREMEHFLEAASTLVEAVGGTSTGEIHELGWLLTELGKHGVVVEIEAR